MKNRSVLVVQRRLTEYRVPFFEALRTEMALRNINLVLAHGRGTAAETSKQDSGYLAWAHNLETRYLLDDSACWQPFRSLAKGSDLVVLAHENKLVLNLFAQYFSRRFRVALWGHGANLQGDPRSWREKVKRRTAVQADWWFGYTDASLPHIQAAGFPVERITILNNSVDTVTLARQLSSVAPTAIHALREKLGIRGENVAVYIGSLYALKGTQFLLDAALSIREEIGDFELVIAGGGPDARIVEEFCCQHGWAHYVGPCKGADKAKLLALAKIMLNPGAVGLGVLDSFVSGVPLITADCGVHGPEIAYIKNGINGVITNNDLVSYVEAVISVLRNGDIRSSMNAACKISATAYTVENMARSFCDGVERCLGEPPLRT